MTTFERLKEKIFNDTGVKLENFNRTYAGAWMKGSGAYVWTANYEGQPSFEAGSGVTATDLLKLNKIEIINKDDLGCRVIEFS